MQQAAAYARQKKLRIIPECPFAGAIFEKNREFTDVKKANIRLRSGAN